MREKDIAAALAELIKVLPEKDVPHAYDGALKLLEKSGVNDFQSFPSHVAEALATQEGIVTASLATPTGSVGKEHHDKFAHLLEQTLGRKVQLTEVKDPTLIGGAVLRIGDEMYDFSIRSAMENMVTHFLKSRFQFSS